MIVSQETHDVLVSGITQLRAEAMRLRPRMIEHDVPLTDQLDQVVASLAGIEREFEDIRPGDDHDLKALTDGLATIGQMLIEIASLIDRVAAVRRRGVN